MFILNLALILLLVYFLINVTRVIIRNHHAHKFFKTKTPRLPMVSEPNIFIGNLHHTLYDMKNYLVLDRLHNKLGKTYGYYFSEQPWVSTKDIDLIKRIEVDEAHKHLDRINLGIPTPEFNNSIFQINGNEWRKVRRALAPTLTNLRVRSDEVSADMDQVIDRFVRSLEGKLAQAEQATAKRSVILDTHDYALRITLEVIFLVFYNKADEVDFDAVKDKWVTQIESATMMMVTPLYLLVRSLPFINPFADWLLKLPFHLIGRLMLTLLGYINDVVDSRLLSEKKFANMQRKLVDQTSAKDPIVQTKDSSGHKRRLIDGFVDAVVEGKITREHFVGSAYFLLFAGFETTAGTVTCLLWHLAKNPEIQEKLRTTIVEEGVDADYVVWCIMETVRWHPAVPLGVGRVLGEDVTTNDGLLLPKGTFVMPSIYSIHHDDSIWPEADKFIPERWRYQSDFHTAAFMGFGLGPRNCPGGKMAIHELKLIVKALLTRYKIERCDDTPDEYNFFSPVMIGTIPEKPVKLQFSSLD